MPDICCSRAADHDGLLVLLTMRSIHTMRSIQINRHKLCRKTHAYAEPSPAKFKPSFCFTNCAWAPKGTLQNSLP